MLALPLLSVQVEIFVSEGLFQGRTAAKQQVRACGHIGVLMRNLCPLRVSEQERYGVFQQMACACLRRHTEWVWRGRTAVGGGTCVEGWARRFLITKGTGPGAGGGYYLQRSECELCE